MTNRRVPASNPEAPILSVEQKRRRIERLQNCIRELESFDPQRVEKRHGVPEVLALEAAIKDVLSATFGHGTPAYLRYSTASTLDNGPHFARSDLFAASVNYEAQDVRQARQYLAEGKEKSIALLKQAIRTIEEEIADEEQVTSPPGEQQRPKIQARKVFVVHGHDEAALQSVARFLKKLKLEAIILQEQPDQGRTIIEKFEAYAGEVGFAVVLLTPDDFASVGEQLNASRARQNVIFELGYFVGRLGRGRACLLRKGQVEIPSDLYGVIYTVLDAAEGWKLKLVKELKAAKMDFDANQMWA